MIDVLLNDFLICTGGIFFIWSIVLVWGTCHLYQIARLLDEQRAEIRRWRRLMDLRDNTQTQQRK